MPGGMDGRQLVRNALRLWPSLSVLFASGYAERAVFGRGDFDQSYQLLTKPYRIEGLATAIHSSLSSRIAE